jgi:hypothetical protein
MSRELLEKCLQDIKAMPQPPAEIVPSNFGEAFLAPDWAGSLQLIAKRLPRTGMVVPTNGTLLTEANVVKLAQVPTLKLVNFSVNAIRKETYEAFHGLPFEKSYETITNAVVRLRQLRPDVTVWVSMVRSSEYQSPGEAELFVQHWGSVVGPQNVQLNQAEYSQRPPIVPVTLACRSLWSDLVVLWDGRCMSCCYAADAQEDMVVGDATVEPLLDIWHGKRFSELRRVHSEGRRVELPTCSRCTFA